MTSPQLTIIPEQMKAKIRQYLIRQGVIKPRNIAETRAAFPFPYQRIETRVTGIALSRSMEALHYVHKSR